MNKKKKMEYIKVWVNTMHFSSILECSKLCLLIKAIHVCGSKCMWKKYLWQLYYKRTSLDHGINPDIAINTFMENTFCNILITTEGYK